MYQKLVVVFFSKPIYYLNQPIGCRHLDSAADSSPAVVICLVLGATGVFFVGAPGLVLIAVALPLSGLFPVPILPPVTSATPGAS